MKFTKEQLELLKNCHPEANENGLLAELEMKYQNGVSFEYLLENLPEALEKRATLPWMVARRSRLWELEQILGDIPEMKDENFRVMADRLMCGGEIPVEGVAAHLKKELEGKPLGDLPIRNPVVLTIVK